MTVLLFVVLFVTLATALFSVSAATLAPASLVGMRLRSLVGFRTGPEKPDFQDRFQDAMGPLSRAIPQSPDEVSRTRAWLMMAGYREQRHMTIYLGLRVLCAGLFVLPAILTGYIMTSPMLGFALAGLGYMAPRFILKRRIKARQHRIELGLADALDLSVICVEAGLGLDQAVQRVGLDLAHSHPDLSEELGLVGLEMRAGKPRAEALRNLATRTGVDDVRALVAVLVQTDRFGTSVAQALRVHSDALRTERRQRAEERAAKTTIKMVPVLVFFVFPSMFVVSLGPAIIQLVRVLLPSLNK